MLILIGRLVRIELRKIHNGYSEKVNVWAEIKENMIIEPRFPNETLLGSQYLEILKKFALFAVTCALI